MRIRLALAFLLLPAAALAQSGPHWPGPGPVWPTGYPPLAFGIDTAHNNYPSWETEWESKLDVKSAYANVRSYGAVLSGAVPDTTAFNNARNAIANNSSVFVPAGFFNVPGVPTAGPAQPIVWKLDGLTYAGGVVPVLGLGTDMVENTYSGTQYFGRTASIPNPGPVVRIDYAINQASAGNGAVAEGLSVNAIQNSGTVDSAWAVVANLQDHAADNGAHWPEPVALGADLDKFANSPAWSAQFNAVDHQSLPSSTGGGMFGLEVGFNSDGVDDADSRRLLDLIASPYTSTGHVGTGIYVRTLTGETIDHGLRLSGAFGTGIDLSAASFTGLAANFGTGAIAAGASTFSGSGASILMNLNGTYPVGLDLSQGFFSGDAIRLASGMLFAWEVSDTIHQGWINNALRLRSGTTDLSVTDGSGNFTAKTVSQTGFVAPASATATCTTGQAGDAEISGTAYHFACVSSNTWARVAMTIGGW